MVCCATGGFLDDEFLDYVGLESDYRFAIYENFVLILWRIYDNSNLGNYFKVHKFKLIILCLFSIIAQLVTVILPILSALLIDELISKKNQNSLNIIFLFSILLCFKLIIEYFFKVGQTKGELDLQYYIQKESINKFYFSNFSDNNSQNLTLYSRNILEDGSTISSFL